MSKGRNEGELNRDDAVPVQGRHLQRLMVEGTNPIKCVILSTKFEGYWCHWESGKSVACRKGDDGKCACGPDAGPRKWYAFIVVLHWEERVSYVVMMTADSVENLQRVVMGEGQLRGLVVGIRRRYNTKKSSICFDHHKTLPASDPLPSAAPILPTLKRLWKFAG